MTGTTSAMFQSLVEFFKSKGYKVKVDGMIKRFFFYNPVLGYRGIVLTYTSPLGKPKSRFMVWYDPNKKEETWDVETTDDYEIMLRAMESYCEAHSALGENPKIGGNFV
jgi:hypothetical protein